MPYGKGTYGNKVGRPAGNKGKISGTMPTGSRRKKSKLKKGTGSKSSRRPGPTTRRGK
jgi:hypothetical protein